MRRDSDPIQAAAEFMAAELHPQDRKAAYAWHVRVKAKADALFYLLQALSLALTSICFGLVTNYLYDVAKEKFGDKREDTDASLRQYQERIEELKAHLAKLQPQHRKAETAREWLRFHELMILRIEERDPEIAACVAQAVEQLEKRGAASLATEVSHHAKLPS